MASRDDVSHVYLDMSYKLHYPKGASQLDNLPEDLKAIVHPYWGEFPPQHPMINDCLGIIFLLLWFIAVVGNGCVIYVFLTTKSLRTPTNMFIVNLAISDFCMMSTQGLPVSINVFMDRHFMYSPLMCRVYGCIGGIFGTNSLMTMVVIGYDRYNVIVKGFSGVKITPGKAAIMLIAIWIYSTLGSLPPFIFGWGDYALEGGLITCSYDYLSEDWYHKSFILYAFVCNYVMPMCAVIFFYSQIVKAVVSHEAALRKQAAKMNVESLRSNKDASAESAEMRIAKVAITNVCLWACTWSPYAFVVMIACFGDRSLITPLASQAPSFVAKTASCLNPIVFAISHPKYREALTEKFPCLGIKEEASDTKTQAETVHQSEHA